VEAVDDAEADGTELGWPGGGGNGWLVARVGDGLGRVDLRKVSDGVGWKMGVPWNLSCQISGLKVLCGVLVDASEALGRRGSFGACSSKGTPVVEDEAVESERSEVGLDMLGACSGC